MILSWRYYKLSHFAVQITSNSNIYFYFTKRNDLSRIHILRKPDGLVRTKLKLTNLTDLKQMYDNSYFDFEGAEIR